MATRKKTSLGDVASQQSKATKTNGDGGWFAAGWDAVEAEEKRQEVMRASWGQDRKFWVGAKESAKIIFIDGVPFTVRQHEYDLEGDWRKRVYKTCLMGTGEKCPFCESGNRAKFVGYLTVIDTREWKSKDGSKSGKNEIKSFPASSQASAILKKVIEKRGPLAGCLYDVSRTGKKSPRVGDMFDLEKKLNLSDPKVQKALGLKGTPKPLDYKKILAPMTRKDALEWLKTAALEEATETDEAVPY